MVNSALACGSVEKVHASPSNGSALRRKIRSLFTTLVNRAEAASQLRQSILRVEEHRVC